MTLSPEVAALLRQALNEAEHLSGYDDRKAFGVLAACIDNLLEPLPEVPDGFVFVARWHEQGVDLAEMARTHGADARCCHPGPAGGLPLIIRPVNVHN